MKNLSMFILVQTCLAYLDNLTIENIGNIKACLNRRAQNPSISCDIHIKLFLEACSGGLIEVFKMIDAEKRESFPLLIYPGVQSGMLKQLGSSSSGSNTGSNRARLDIQNREGSGSWIPETLAAEEYLQFSAFKPVKFHSVQTKGDLIDQKWVKSFRIQYTLDGNTWLMYKNGFIFQGNTNNYQGVNNSFVPFLARAVRILPQDWSTSIALRAEMYISEIYYEAEPPSERLVLIQSVQSGFHAIGSTVWDSYHQIDKLHLDFRSNLGYSAWCPAWANDKQWVIISSPTPVRWHRISIQARGRDAYSSRSKSIYILYTVDGLDWIDYQDKTELVGCYDDFTINSIELVPFIALALKIIPKNYTDNKCMRLEAYCSRL